MHGHQTPFWLTLVRWMLIPYHFILIIGFAILYGNMGLKEHFGVEKPTPFMPFYYSVVSHTGTGYGDITPQTDYARQFVTAHLCLAWIPTAIVFSY